MRSRLGQTREAGDVDESHRSRAGFGVSDEAVSLGNQGPSDFLGQMPPPGVDRGELQHGQQFPRGFEGLAGEQAGQLWVLNIRPTAIRAPMISEMKLVWAAAKRDIRLPNGRASSTSASASTMSASMSPVT